MASTSPASSMSPRHNLAEAHGDAIPNPDALLWHLLSASAARHPHREAVVSLWQDHHDFFSSSSSSSSSSSPASPARQSHPHTAPRRSCTYQALLRRSESLALWLRRQGCRPGMRLAVYLWNSTEWALFLWAALRLGLVFSPLDPRSLEAGSSHHQLAKVAPSVLVVQDGELAGCVDADDEEEEEEEEKEDDDEASRSSSTRQQRQPALLRLQCSGELRRGWRRPLDSSQAASPSGVDTRQDPAGADSDAAADPDAPALIVFTSGTTTTPKACVHSRRNITSQSFNHDPNLDPDFVDRWLVHTPVSHIFAINNALRSWRDGSVVVFPSKVFDVGSTLRALVEERCTVMSAVPTLVKALIGHPDFPGPGALHLSVVTIGGTMISEDDIRLCRQGLGARDPLQVYGMSEGAPILTWTRPEMKALGGFHRAVGKALPGCRVRVCEPGTRTLLKRGELGELHIGGDSVIAGYLDESSRDFYADESGSWLATGDQARMDDSGAVEILGRYKDLIIRGGENISPAQIEAAIMALPGVACQVVGISDELAGQVPAAVVKLPADCTKEMVMEKALGLGTRFALARVLHLGELGMDNFPVTSIGKVKKETLRQAVEKAVEADKLQRRKGSQVMAEAQEPSAPEKPPLGGPNASSATQSTLAQLVDVWESLIGTRPRVSDDISKYADSITALRYCDQVLGVTGHRLYLQDLVVHSTISDQAELLVARASGILSPALQKNAASQALVCPPAAAQAKDVVEDLSEHKEAANHSRASSLGDHGRGDLAGGSVLDAAESTIWKVGGVVDDIEDIVPVREGLRRLLDGPRPQSFHIRTIFRVPNRSAPEVRAALEKGLASRPMLRTIAMGSSYRNAFHITIRPATWLYRCLIRQASARDKAQADAITSDDSDDDHASPFMFQAKIISVRDAAAAAAAGETLLSLTYNHAVVDALSLVLWHQDLDRLIRDKSAAVAPLTAYKFFVDLLCLNQCNVMGEQAVGFHVRRLRGISRCRAALWPRQRAPGWMLSNDAGSRLAGKRDEAREVVWQGRWREVAPSFRYPRCSRIVCLPGLEELRARGIEPWLVAKSAIALFSALQTRSSYAIFNTWESARKWPFIPEWMDELLPPAMSIDGPTVDWVLNLVEIRMAETVGQFLSRMLGEHHLLLTHAHAPWSKVLEGLHDEAEVAVDASYRQSFVWDVSMGLAGSSSGVFKAMEPVARYDWPDSGLFWNAFMLDKHNLYFIASWDTAQMNDEEMDRHCDALADVMRRLAGANNWEKSMSEIVEGSLAGAPADPGSARS